MMAAVINGSNRFSNYMDKCSNEQSFLAVDEFGNVGIRSLKSLRSLAQADWKTLSPPKKLDHRSFRLWMNGSTGKCLTVLSGDNHNKRPVGLAACELDGSNLFQLFAFRFHYHNAFCCCNVHNV